MSEEPPRKRFRYQTYNKQLSQIKVESNRSKGLSWTINNDEDESEDEAQSRTPLTTSLTDLSLLHLCIPYVEITRQIIPLTRTLPLTLHNLSATQGIFHGFFAGIESTATKEASGLDGILVLYEKLYETVLEEGLPHIDEGFDDLLRIGALKGLQPTLVEKTYTCASALIKLLAPSLLITLDKSPSAPIPSTSSSPPPPPIHITVANLWSTLSPYLSSDRPHVRNCVAGIWSVLLRRARGAIASRLIEVMLLGGSCSAEREEKIEKRYEEGVVLVLSDSMKGAPHLLHSRAEHLYSILLQHLVLSQNTETASLLRILVLLTTSLIHHCSSTNLIPLHDIVLSLLRGNAQAFSAVFQTAAMDVRQMSLILRIASVFVAVRKGQRLASGSALGEKGGSESILQRYMMMLLDLSPKLRTTTDPEWRRNYIRLLVSCLIAGKLSDWLSPGVKLIDITWELFSVTERFNLIDTLGKLKWLGMEQFLLSHVAKLSLQTLPTHPLKAGRMLFVLTENGYLDGGLVNVQGGKWKEGLGRAIAGLFDKWADGDSTLDEFTRSAIVYLLRVLPKLGSSSKLYLPALTDLSHRISRDALLVTASQAREEFAQSALSNGYLLGEILQCLGHLSEGSDSARRLIKQLVGDGKEMLEIWGWHRSLLKSCADTVEYWGNGTFLKTVSSNLTTLLISEDSELKASALRILSSLPQPRLNSAGDDSPHSASVNLFEACLEVEEAGMSLQNVRERTTRIRKVGLLVKAATFSSENIWLLEAIVSFLCSQFKVNFRPLYPDTIETLADIAEGQSQIIWDRVFAQMEACLDGTLRDAAANTLAWAAAPEDEDELAPLEEKSMTCPNAAKLDRAVEEEAISGEEEAKPPIALKAQITETRLDTINYEAQLVGVLKAVPTLAERHGRQLVPILLNLAQRELQTEDSDAAEAAHMSQKVYQGKLSTYLELFAKMNNPKALYRSEEVHACYLDLLSVGENKMQSLALSCLQTFKDPSLVPYEERLSELLIDSKFRDTLTKLSLAATGESIDPAHRERLIPVVMRLLYGIMVARRGRNSSNQGAAARKHAILAALSACHPEELSTLVNLMLKPFERASAGRTGPSALQSVSGKRQTGYLILLGDVIKHLAPQTMPFWDRLLEVCLEVTVNAQLIIGSTVEAEEVAEEEITEARNGSIPAKTIRQLGLRRFADFFSVKVEYDFSKFLPRLFSGVVCPRLPTFAAENTQAPSALMEVFASWTRPEYLPYLVDYDDRVVGVLFKCLGQPKTKTAVIKRVFDVAETLIRYTMEETEGNNLVSARLLRPNMTGILDNMAQLMSSTLKGIDSAKDDLVKRAIIILGRLAPLAESAPHASELIELLTPLLKRPAKKVSERVKTDILLAICPLYNLVPESRDHSSPFYRRNINLISALFRSMRTRPARQALTSVFTLLATHSSELQAVLELVQDLNAYSVKRVDEPDFERRLKAFSQLNDEHSNYPDYSAVQWAILLHNFLFFVQDPEELSIRSNASHGLKRFISMAATEQDEEYIQLVMNVIYPALRNMIGSRSELIRAESISILAQAVKTCSHIEVLREMTPLLAAGDEEASVFNNLYHLQIHRRARAIHRLAELAFGGGIREVTWSNVFLPVIGHIVTDVVEKDDHALINEAITSIGKISGVLAWSRYQSLALSYLRLGKVEGKNQKQLVRTVTSILDNFHFEMEQMVDEVPPTAQVAGDEPVEEEMEEDPDQAARVASDGQSKRIAEYVVNRLLPALNDFIAQKDEAEFTIRIPVALGVIKVAMALPEEHKEAEIARTVLTLSQVLRSKDQDTRDLVKETMAKIAVRLGPRWLPTILKEMRAALQRGPQLQVLAVVTHAILVHATTEAPTEFANLDSAVADIVHVSAEVIWGQSGSDVLTDGFKTKMREVRSGMSRGYDSFQMVARLVSPAKISRILIPIKSIMQETHAIKQMQQIDECLRRVASGLNANQHVHPQDLLRLCHTLINANSEFFKPAQAGSDGTSDVKESFKVQLKRKLAIDENHFEENSHKFIAFGLDLFVTAFRRGRFDFSDPDILARMNPLVNSIGNTLYAKEAGVVTLGLRASAAILQCPLPSVEKALPTFIQHIINIIKRNGGSSDSEVAMTALKCLAVIIRDCKASQLKEKQVTFLLEIITPDLEEHEKQATLFAILRAIVSRKFVVAEIYDLMEKVSAIMVTSQSSHVQELCRSVLIQFLLDYPQGKGRLRTQMSFLAQNLSYVYESGRVSVMELLSAIFNKFSEDLVKEYSDMFFLALVMVLSNDESEKCRTMAGALIKQLLQRYDPEKLSKLVQMLASWSGGKLSSTPDAALTRSSAIVSGILIQAIPDLEIHHIHSIVRNMTQIIRTSSKSLSEQEEMVSNSIFPLEHSLDYTLPYHALSTLSRCLESGRTTMKSVLRRDIISLLLFPHDWVRVAAAKVLNAALAPSAPSPPMDSTAVMAINPTAIIKPTIDFSSDDLLEIAKKSCLILRGSHPNGGERDVPSSRLCDEVVKLLFGVAKRWIGASGIGQGVEAASGSNGVETEGETAMEEGVEAEVIDEEEEEVEVGEDADQGEEEHIGQEVKAPLSWLMSRLSFLARNLIIGRPSASELISKPIRWSQPLTSIFHLFAGIIDLLQPPQSSLYLRHILSPLFRIAGDITDFYAEADTQNQEVYNLAVELREMVQGKVGMNAFSAVWEDLRKKAGEKRGMRRRVKEEMAVSNPEGYAQRKEQRGAMKKDSKKRKQRSFADAKQRERPMKGRRVA